MSTDTARHFRALVNRLDAHANTMRHPSPEVVQALGVPVKDVIFTGVGRDIRKDNDHFSLYVKGVKENSFLTHVLRANAYSMPDASGRRRGLGSIGINLNRDDLMTVYAQGFDRQITPHVDTEKLLAPLGEWVVNAALRAIDQSERDFTKDGTHTRGYVTPSVQNLSPINDFITDPSNGSAYHTLVNGLRLHHVQH